MQKTNEKMKKILKINKNHIIFAISALLIAKLFILALQDQSQWKGFFVTSFNIIILAAGSAFLLKKIK